MNKKPSHKANPIIYLKKGLFIFPIAQISIESTFRGENFKIINSGDGPIDISIPHGSRGSGKFTKCNFLWMEYRSDRDDHWEIFAESLEIINVLSLLLIDLYLDNNTLEEFTYPGSLSFNVPLSYPKKYIGINIKNGFKVYNKTFDKLIKRVNNLPDEDYNYFKSAAHLIKEAKKDFYKGNNSESIMNAISAVEALYTKPDNNGIYRLFDQRFNLPKGREKAFKKIFCNNKSYRRLYNSFSLNPYAIRSGYLHSGVIDFFVGSRSRKRDKYLDFILNCQKVIINSLKTFGV